MYLVNYNYILLLLYFILAFNINLFAINYSKKLTDKRRDISKIKKYIQIKFKYKLDLIVDKPKSRFDNSNNENIEEKNI